MPLDLTDCQFSGPALPDPFVKLELEKELSRRKLLAKTTGRDGKQLKERWDVYRRKLRSLAASGGAMRVRNHVIEPLAGLLGYARIEDTPDVQTREDLEPGGVLLVTDDGQTSLRVWTAPFDIDLFAPSKRGRAYRFSHLRIAQRVLLATGERAGLLTNGVHLMLLISDPARPDSTVSIPLDAGWKRSRDVPDSFRFLLALASPGGLAAIPEIVDKARLGQVRVTRELRKQARRAVSRFVQEILDHPGNRDLLQQQADRQQLASDLWREGLITVYRLLFLLKLEASDDVARSFSFASTSLWRNTFSPGMALAGYARDVLERGMETGSLLESGLRALFRMFEQGLECTELVVKPLGGSLFGEHVTPTLTQLAWGERAVAHLLDQLLWTTPQRRGKGAQRERVHYGALDVEDLGRVYEALLELEPGIATEPMCRLKRQKLEVVVPLAQGEQYRPVEATDLDPDGEDETDDEETPTARRGKKTQVGWIEEIGPGRFYLRVGLGRKSSGSYYTPHSFVRFLVQETLGPQVAECSPNDDPQPLAILNLKVLDPAMGSGHFLVEACRFLGEKLYEACRLCDENALAAERRVEKVRRSEAEALEEEARGWWQRVIDLPDPDDELLRYLPSRSPEGEETGLSQQRAIALCRRLVATHCLYGVDKNPLAVELAKLALWLESHAEGMPLTFLDHRLVLGDSLTGPFWEHLLKRPGKPDESFEAGLFRGIEACFTEALYSALRHVRRLEAGVGATVAENAEKDAAKHALDAALLPIRLVAAAWSGGVMLGPDHCNDADYLELLKHVAVHREPPATIESESLRRMIARGLGVEEIPSDRESLYRLIDSGRCTPALAYDLAFPEVFYPNGVPHSRQGFHAVLGNPPWNKANLEMPEFMASYDFRFAEADATEREALVEQLKDSPAWHSWLKSADHEDCTERAMLVLHPICHSQEGGFGSGHSDIFAPFIASLPVWLRANGMLGMVLPSALHVSKSLAQLRRMLLQNATINSYFCFENKRSLFEIHKSWKFTPVVVANTPARIDHSFPSQFYLHNDEWLHANRRSPREFSYSVASILETDPETLIFQEFTSPEAAECSAQLYDQSVSWKEFAETSGWRLRRELNATDDRWRVTDNLHPKSILDTSPPAFVHHKPGSIHQFTDEWHGTETSAVPVANLADKRRVLYLGRFYRALYRMTARATDQRTGIYTIVPPGTTATNTVPIEGDADKRPNCVALGAVAVCNAFSFDWGLRLRVGSKTVSKFIMETTRIPVKATTSLLCCHGALRLIASRKDFVPLWREQLGDAWREPGKEPLTWPVLETDDERWVVRAAIDAVVADAYGLSREQYEHVLSTFSHASYPGAPALCLARFDELQEIGLEAFTRRYDPYHDIPLNENLPQPVIDLPIPDEENKEEDGEFRLTGRPAIRGRQRKSPE